MMYRSEDDCGACCVQEGGKYITDDRVGTGVDSENLQSPSSCLDRESNARCLLGKPCDRGKETLVL